MLEDAMSTQGRFVGMVKPTSQASGSHDALTALLPAEIRTHTVYCGIRDGTVEEFKTIMPQYERGVAEVAALKVDLIHAEGTPPFMLRGYAGEQRIIAGWEEKYGIPVFTSGTNQVRAMKALGATRVVGAGYDSITGPIVERYFSDAGFDVLAIEKVKATWEEVGLLTDDAMIEMMTEVFRRHPGGQVMYLQGSKWPSLNIVDRLEARIGVPVVQAVAARCWELQVRFGLRRPQHGYGRLLAEMPGARDA
jgi:maleate cis-trans isomerase